VAEDQSSESLPADDVAAVERLRDAFKRLEEEMGKVIVGQRTVLEELLTAIFARGHCLLIGVPGLAKTLMIHTLADALNLTFSRIQFTPDLMPADITGTEVIQEDKATGIRQIKFLRGPVFANLILADEINRTPPKTQSALLEAMQEMSCTVRGNHYKLPRPFFVLATQNPIELEGTYPLPEAQLDRFLFNTLLDYLSPEDELKVIGLTTTTHVAKPVPVTTAEEILGFQQLVRQVPIAESVARYAVSLIRATRATDPTAPDFIKKYVNFGCSVRGIQNLVLASKARALMQGRYHVSYDDIRALAPPIVRHRMLLNFQAESDKLTTDDIAKKLLDAMPVPRG
jgi:MoxR-like ATPase